MLPTDLQLEEPKSKEWSLISADVYQTEITKIDYKQIDNKWKKETTDPDKKQVMEFEFTIIEEGQYYGRKLWKQMAPIKPYPPMGGKESWVYRLASALAGHSISKDEADHYTAQQINDFFHAQVRITVSVSAPKDNGKQYNNIDSFLTIKAKLPIFDENKIPKENLPEPQNTSSDAQNQVVTNDNTASDSRFQFGKNEPELPTIQQEVNVEDIPF